MKYKIVFEFDDDSDTMETNINCDTRNIVHAWEKLTYFILDSSKKGKENEVSGYLFNKINNMALDVIRERGKAND